MGIRTPRFSSNGRGQSAIEVLLSIPFLMLVMLLGVNFGKAFLLKQNAAIAARYASWQEARTGKVISDTDLTQAGYGGNQMRFSPLRGDDAGGRARNEVGLASGGLAGFFEYFWGGLRGRTAYKVSYSWSPLGRVLREGFPSGEHYVVIEDWRCGRGGTDYVSGTGSILGAASRFLGSAFKSC